MGSCSYRGQQLPDSAGQADKLETQESQWYSFHVKARNSWCSSGKAGRQEKFSLTQGRVGPFILFRPSTDEIVPICIKESNLPKSSLLISVLTSCKNTLTETPRIIFEKIPWTPCGPVESLYKVNHHKWFKAFLLPERLLLSLSLPWDLEFSFLWTPRRSFWLFHLSWRSVTHDLAL